MRKVERNRASRGFSLVELMMVIIITTIGFLALVNLQVGTLRAVNDSRSMMEAVNLAEHFIETLKSESISWNGDATSTLLQPNLALRFQHLRLVGPAAANGSSGWLEAYQTSESDRRVGPVGNYSDNAEIDEGISREIPPQINRRYCVHYRLTWLVPDYLIRADVRVLWMRDESNFALYQDCAVGSEMHKDMGNVGSITVPATVMRNVFSQ
jgi:prepilin-type N-terminal cleavage/methylation domain-containing protein